LLSGSDSACSCFIVSAQVEDLHHVINAGDTDTFAIDFEFGSSKAKPNKQEVIIAPPTLQVRGEPRLLCCVKCCVVSCAVLCHVGE